MWFFSSLNFKTVQDGARCVRCIALRRRAAARVAMALSTLSGDEQGILFVQLCNVLDPGLAVALASVSNELRTATRVPLQQLKTDHEAAAALCRKLGHRNCKALREAKEVECILEGLTLEEMKLLGTMGSVLPALKRLDLSERAAGPDGVPSNFSSSAVRPLVRLGLPRSGHQVEISFASRSALQF